MRLERLEVIPYSLPFREPYLTARGELRERGLALVRVHAEGLVGLGEAAPLALRGGRSLDELVDELTGRCWPALTDGRFDPHRIWSAVARCRNRGASAQAIAAIDIALHDLAGKAIEIPVWRLLGAERAAPVPCNATLPAGNPTTLARLAERWAADGFRSFKLKVGMAGDVRQVESVRATLGDEALIRVDANAAWSVSEAAERLQEIAGQAIELAEQPVAGLEEMASLRGLTEIPLAADESVITPRDARRAVELGACELATVKLAKAGGIGGSLEVAGEIPAYLSSALDGPVGVAAAAHAAQALAPSGPAAGLAHGLATERLFASSIGTGIELRGAELIPGDAPGLGVEIDDERLAAASFL
jgi:muconate cycloisomerase